MTVMYLVFTITELGFKLNFLCKFDIFHCSLHEYKFYNICIPIIQFSIINLFSWHMKWSGFFYVFQIYETYALFALSIANIFVFMGELSFFQYLVSPNQALYLATLRWSVGTRISCLPLFIYSKIILEKNGLNRGILSTGLWIICKWKCQLTAFRC